MHMRAVWVFYLQRTDGGRLVFSRRFTTVEKQAKLIEGDHYHPLPKNVEFSKSLNVQLSLKKKFNKFIEFRDSCKKTDNAPVHEVATPSGLLWPVTVIERNGYLFCCLSLVEQGAYNRPSLVDIPSVTLGFSLLTGMAEFVSTLRGPSSEQSSTISSELHSFLSEASPFGTVRDVNSASVSSKISNKRITTSLTQKQPTWKPVLYRGKSQIYLCISEYIKAVIYGSDAGPNVWDLSGVIGCRADLEGTMADITLNVSHVAESQAIPLDHIVVHPCVQSADTEAVEFGSPRREVRATPRRIRFTPPTEQFTLCHYTALGLDELPITGHYDMTEDRVDGKLNVEVKLKLSHKVKNLFDQCELHIPIYNRGILQNVDICVSQGYTQVIEKRLLIWTIGQKFPSKNLEVFLSGTIQYNTQGQKSAAHEDPFCTGQNAYALLNFKMADYTHSGCYIDPKSVQISSNIKYKLTTVREYLSSEYKIWNSQGDVLKIYQPKGVL